MADSKFFAHQLNFSFIRGASSAHVTGLVNLARYKVCCGKFANRRKKRNQRDERDLLFVCEQKSDAARTKTETAIAACK